jgi:Vacuolar segregation subunit 7
MVEDSLFTQQLNFARHPVSPQPATRGSPRSKNTVPRNGVPGGTVKTPKWAQSNFYDGDDDDNYPDLTTTSNERVPLLPRDMNRTAPRRFKGYRSRNRVVSAKQQQQIQTNYERRRSGRHRPIQATSQGGMKCWPGLAGTAILTSTLILLTMLTIGFVFQTSRSLENLHLANITNIVVSQEELVMDISLEAGNPNILRVILGESISLDIFARSDHFEDKSLSEEIHPAGIWPPWLFPPEDSKPPKTNLSEGPSLLLGTVRSLEAPLSFPPTGFRSPPTTSQRSELKLMGPAANASNGQEKWAKCILFNFELIVRGTIKYRAPIGGKERAGGVEWRGMVDPLRNKIWPLEGEEIEWD